MTATLNAHELQVDRGVALLDARLGRDVWLPRVDASTLDVGSPTNCVACQVTDSWSYYAALAWFGVGVGADDGKRDRVEGMNWTEAHGFGIENLPGRSRDFAGLTTAWVNRVGQLRGESD